MKNQLHLIEEDLEEEGWIPMVLIRIEAYLVKWARFQERHGV